MAGRPGWSDDVRWLVIIHKFDRKSFEQIHDEIIAIPVSTQRRYWRYYKLLGDIVRFVIHVFGLRTCLKKKMIIWLAFALLTLHYWSLKWPSRELRFGWPFFSFHTSSLSLSLSSHPQSAAPARFASSCQRASPISCKSPQSRS